MNLKFDFNQITDFDDFINNVLISPEVNEIYMGEQKFNICSIDQIKQKYNCNENQSPFLSQVNEAQKKVQNNYTQSEILSSKSLEIPMQQFNDDNEVVHKRGLKRLKQEIKTFPNFIYRVFDHHLSKYQKQISPETLMKLREYLEKQRGKKHYTLNHLCTLLKDDERWDCRINRVILNKILNSFSYLQIFKNSQRKKKKTYLIMTKVYKLRCRNAFLSSRVQCQ